MLFQAIPDFFLRFGQMNVQRVVLFFSHFHAAPQVLFAYDVDGMGHYGKLYPFRFAGVSCQKIKIRLEPFRRNQHIGDGDTDACPNSHLFDHLHGLFSVPVHVRKEYRAGLDHLQHCKAAPDFDVPVRKLCLEGPNVFVQPLGKFHIVGVTPQKAHGRMGVAIVKGGHQG